MKGERRFLSTLKGWSFHAAHTSDRAAGRQQCRATRAPGSPAPRSHFTCIGGIIDTFTIAATVHSVFKVAAFWAQAIALLLAVLRTVFAGLLLYLARA